MAVLSQKCVCGSTIEHPEDPDFSLNREGFCSKTCLEIACRKYVRGKGEGDAMLGLQDVDDPLPSHRRGADL